MMEALVEAGTGSSQFSSVDRIQGTHLRFKCELHDASQALYHAPMFYDSLCHQIDSLVKSFCSARPTKIAFSDPLDDGTLLEGLARLERSINKQTRHSELTVQFLLEIPETNLLTRGSLSMKRTEWPRSKSPLKNFLRKYQCRQHLLWERRAEDPLVGSNESLNFASMTVPKSIWYRSTVSYNYEDGGELLDCILETKMTDSQVKEFLLDHYDKPQLLRHGSSLIRNIKAFLDTSTLKDAGKSIPDDDCTEKGCFPLWTEDRLQALRTKTHQACSSLYAEVYDPDCGKCSEQRCLEVLQWWYMNVFNPLRPSNEEQEDYLVRSDMSMVKKPFRRLKGLIFRSEREAGKTSWFQAICQGDLRRIVHFKNKFNTEEADKLKQGAERIWLILIDDFSKFSAPELQAIKALLVGEATTILGKWLSYNYHGGVPCVILCNSREQFQSLYEDPDIYSQCKFINLPPSVYLGPPGTRLKLTTEFDNIQNAL